MSEDATKSVAVIVAHPDDETLWAGGTILGHPTWNWHIVTVCRASDPDRAPRFRQALGVFHATGQMGDLEDGPEQTPLDAAEVEDTIQRLLPASHFDLVITHDPRGEYTRHRRHEEVARAVISLWRAGKISTDELWTFAYEDGGKTYLPRPIQTAPGHRALPEQIWLKKYGIITRIYGFGPDGFEAKTTPRAESFWFFANSADAEMWLDHGGSVA